MLTRDFYFDLPNTAIAQYPLADRSAAKMLVYDSTSGKMEHGAVHQIRRYLKPGDLLVLNDTKVIPARLFGHKSTGGHVELFVDRILTTHRFWAHIRASKAPKPGSVIHLSHQINIDVNAKEHDLYLCSAASPILDILETLGQTPLPPYIQRNPDTHDKTRYQTVYAKHEGSVAAPTAGLHFDQTLMDQLKQAGIEMAYTTLHIGAGTFKPVRVAHIHEHTMHAEWLSVSKTLCDKVNQTKAAGHRVIAVGTTALRAVESAARQGKLHPFDGETRIFITPGYTFQIIDGLMTNFHLPESTLAMLVAALIGYKPWQSLYQEAIQQNYRFFSYGDASLLL